MERVEPSTKTRGGAVSSASSAIPSMWGRLPAPETGRQRRPPPPAVPRTRSPIIRRSRRRPRESPSPPFRCSRSVPASPPSVRSEAWRRGVTGGHVPRPACRTHTRDRRRR
jgi:hypothetical protein